MSELEDVNQQIKELEKKRDALKLLEVAPLRSHHPLYDKGLRRKDICTSCMGYGWWADMIGQKIACNHCNKTGLSTSEPKTYQGFNQRLELVE